MALITKESAVATINKSRPLVLSRLLRHEYAAANSAAAARVTQNGEILRDVDMA